MATLIQQIDGTSVRFPNTTGWPLFCDANPSLNSVQVHHLQSGQVINDGLNSAVKELVENALDANATSIEIRFKNYGLESLEVIDNGDGISPDNYESIGSPPHLQVHRTRDPVVLTGCWQP
jgi:hypothetical protein